MKIQPTTTRLNFGILAKPPRKMVYAPNCWNEISEGNYKGYNFVIFQNYEDNKKNSTLIILRNCGKWVLSKLKYFENGVRKTKWSYANEKNA